MYRLMKVELGSGEKAYIKGADKATFREASILRIKLNRKHIDDAFYFLTVKVGGISNAPKTKNLSGGGVLIGGCPVYKKEGINQ